MMDRMAPTLARAARFVACHAGAARRGAAHKRT